MEGYQQHPLASQVPTPSQPSVQPQGVFNDVPQFASTPQFVPTAQQSPTQPQTNSSTQTPQQNQQAQEDQTLPQNFYYAPEEILLRWTAASRPYKKRDREFYTTIAIIVFLLSTIAFFIGQSMLIAVIVSFAFVAYVLAAVPPEKVEHTITTYGIRTENKLYVWGELGRFWFSETLGQKVLHVEYFNRFLSRISLVLGEVKEEQIKQVLLQYVPHETPLPSFVEKAADWLQKKIPLEKAS